MSCSEEGGMGRGWGEIFIEFCVRDEGGPLPVRVPEGPLVVRGSLLGMERVFGGGPVQEARDRARMRGREGLGGEGMLYCWGARVTGASHQLGGFIYSPTRLSASEKTRSLVSSKRMSS